MNSNRRYTDTRTSTAIRTNNVYTVDELSLVSMNRTALVSQLLVLDYLPIDRSGIEYRHIFSDKTVKIRTSHETDIDLA